jgi:FMN phosphatase YigB (HAD superfamily)
MNDAWFTGFNTDLHNPTAWQAFYTRACASDPSLPKETPSVPSIDGESLFFNMMRQSRAADPWMWPALQALKASGKYLLAALSNTMIFPPEYNENFSMLPNDSKDDVRSIFEVFISSAHVGMRKPNRDIYEYALVELDKYARANASTRGKGLGWENGVKAEEVLFLDDIGENLKEGKSIGFRTIKVHLGRAFEAVDELEKVTGLRLAGDHPRVPVKPVVKKYGKAKL